MGGAQRMSRGRGGEGGAAREGRGRGCTCSCGPGGGRCPELREPGAWEGLGLEGGVRGGRLGAGSRLLGGGAGFGVDAGAGCVVGEPLGQECRLLGARGGVGGKGGIV